MRRGIRGLGLTVPAVCAASFFATAVIWAQSFPERLLRPAQHRKWLQVAKSAHITVD